MQMKMKAKMIILYYMLLLRIINGEEIKIMEKQGEITFSKIADISISLTEYTSIETQKHVIEHSILSIQVTVGSTEAVCDQKGKCENPIRLYGRLNSEPRPEEFLYDKKDDSGKYKDGKFYYGLEYSPCQFGLDDTVNIKIIGVEGKATYKIKVMFIYLNDYKLICPKLSESLTSVPLKIHPAIASTRIGTLQFGGKSPIDNTIDDSLYLIDNKYVWNEISRKDNSEDKTKEIISILDKKEENTLKWPEARIGALMLQIDNNYVIMYGGKDKQQKCLNELWAFNLNSFEWTHIYYNGSLKIPQCKYLSSGQVIHSKGTIIIFGGENDLDDKNIYLIDLKLLKESIEYNKNPSEYTRKYNGISYEEIINHLYQIIEIPAITPRYGLSITQIDNDNVLLYGGFDEKGNPLSTEEILNLKTFKLEILNQNGSTIPLPRGYHSMTKYGSIVFLYGGKSGNVNLKDMWKYIIPIKKWIKINSPIINQIGVYLFLQKSTFVISKIHSNENSNERPIIIGGDVIYNELNSDIIEMNFPLCQSDSMIYSDTLCLPCSEGYEYVKGKCDKCYPGKYLQYDIGAYSKASCASCPEGAYNEYYSQESLSKCLACPYNTYNNIKGQNKCKQCPNDSICLPGSINPLPSHKPLIESYIEKRTYLFEANYPEFIDQNSKMKLLSLTTGVITVSALTTIVIIAIAIFLKVSRNKTHAFLICVDFLPLTGGNEKKSNGGLITIIYSILICSLAISFILRYVLWNDIVEITAIDNSKEQKELSESFRMTIEVIGNEIPCISPEDDNDNLKDKWRSCNDDIIFSKNDDPLFFIDKRKLFTCSKEGRSNQCFLRFTCIDCKDINHRDTINIYFKNVNSYVQVYNWEFFNYWSDSFQNEEKGFSIIKGIFKPYQNIQYNYVFKGIKPSTISFLLTPIYYTMKSENLELSGYRASLNSYKRGDVKNEYTFTNEEEGVRLDIKFDISQSSHQVIVKKDISLLDFFAFLLGMLAGFSFLSRISKFLFEKCNWLNYTTDDFHPLKEEEEGKKAELSMQTQQQNNI